MHDLIRAKWPGHAHIGFIAQHIIGTRQFRLHRRHHQLASPRPQTNNRQAPARSANLQRVQRLLGDCNRNGVVTKKADRMSNHAANQLSDISNRIGKA
ncbi:hypothetical protein D3C84_561630 [compost metagenome]